MKRPRSLISVCTLTFAAMVALLLPAGAAPEGSTLDVQIAHGVSGCEGASSGQTAIGLIPPGFDYRFTATGAADTHQINETHLKFAGYWEKSFRRPAVSGTQVQDLKREIRLAGSMATAWLLAGESQIDEFMREYKSGKAVSYEVALLGCTGSSGSFDAIMSLKEFAIEPD